MSIARYFSALAFTVWVAPVHEMGSWLDAGDALLGCARAMITEPVSETISGIASSACVDAGPLHQPRF
jgi:hypothetical protein